MIRTREFTNSERSRDECDPISTCHRMREYKPKETNQWRRQELVRLNSLPVSARIIVTRPGPSSLVSPVVISRTGFNNEIDFTVSPSHLFLPKHFTWIARTRSNAAAANPISWSPPIVSLPNRSMLH